MTLSQAAELKSSHYRFVAPVAFHQPCVLSFPLVPNSALGNTPLLG
jgi:hypothetical protein